MKLFELVKLPTSIDKKHESLYRAYHTLSLVQHWLAHEVPHEIILELLREIDREPHVEITSDDLDSGKWGQGQA